MKLNEETQKHMRVTSSDFIIRFPDDNRLIVSPKTNYSKFHWMKIVKTYKDLLNIEDISAFEYIFDFFNNNFNFSYLLQIFESKIGNITVAFSETGIHSIDVLFKGEYGDSILKIIKLTDSDFMMDLRIELTHYNIKVILEKIDLSPLLQLFVNIRIKNMRSKISILLSLLGPDFENLSRQFQDNV